MLYLRHCWGAIKRRPMVAAVVFSLAVHAVVFAVILSDERTGPAAPEQVMMIDLTEPPFPLFEPPLDKPQPVVPRTEIDKTVEVNPSAGQAKFAAVSRQGDAMQGNNPAPIRLTMFKAGMRSNPSLKRTRAILQFDESQVSLSSPGSADDILAATHRPSPDAGAGRLGVGAGIGMGSDPTCIGGGMTGGPTCK